MAKNLWKTLAAPAVALLLGLGLGALICYVALESSSASDQTRAKTQEGTAMQGRDKTGQAYAKPQHTGTATKKVFLNASQNVDGNTSSLAKELMGGQDYKQVDLAEYRIPQVGQGDGDFNRVWEQLKGADVIVIGTPVYWSNMSGYLKTFIDHVVVNDDLKGADLYLIVQGSDSDQTRAINATYGTLDRVAKRFGLNLVGIAQNRDQAQRLQTVMLGK
ncbi:flavodoxin family protein [Bifidobacterium favimelis]|uniref:NAD(P)H-dependent oxidoreductase n=1 Tax=Bifidobacterium favimelis TaxID=3122979 RepID=A0ABU8ZL50_9BIFI